MRGFSFVGANNICPIAPVLSFPLFCHPREGGGGNATILLPLCPYILFTGFRRSCPSASRRNDGICFVVYRCFNKLGRDEGATPKGADSGIQSIKVRVGAARQQFVIHHFPFLFPTKI